MKYPTAFFQNVVVGPVGTKCASVTITPDFAFTPVTVTLSTTQTGGHIFYRISALPGKPPVHVGDSAVSPTVRIGSNIGTVTIPSGTKALQAVCYQAGFLDSDITSGEYDAGSG